ncbi:MAG: adenosine deaminase family protein [Deltaproteobacteria bacterium]|nr:adenosine deaminase family protein [Deltaproteobacteria bacterium]
MSSGADLATSYPSLAAVPRARLARFLAGMPKTVLHLHLEGSLEPELAFALAERNGVEPGSDAFPYPDLEALRAAYRFDSLGAFLDVYYAVAGVLRTEQDFVDLAAAYADQLIANNVRVAELFFDPQTHTSRGIAFSTVAQGLWQGLERARHAGVRVQLIASVLRDAPVGTVSDMDGVSAEQGFATMEEATGWATLGQLLDYQSTAAPERRIIGLGLDSYEKPFPPELFLGIYERAHAQGLLTTAHAGEEGPPAYVWTALRRLKVSRIDHGVRSTEDPRLLEHLARPHDAAHIVAAYGEPHRVPLTVCPRSNFMLQVFPDPTASNLLELLDAGVLACIHSDDPAYFGGYATDNYLAAVEWLDPSLAQLHQLARNGVQSAWLSAADKAPLLAELDAYFGEADALLGGGG